MTLSSALFQRYFADQCAIIIPNIFNTGDQDGDGAFMEGAGRHLADMPFTEDGAQHGVIYWLGTSGETSEFRNPSVLGRTILSASSEIDGTLRVLTARAHETGAFFETDEEKGAWIRVDLTADYLLKPTAYTLSYFIEGTEHVPLNWEFQVIEFFMNFHH